MKGALHTSFVDARGRQVAWGSTWPGSDFLFGAMRGFDSKQSSMFCLRSPETVVPADHPLRGIKKRVDAALAQLSPAFDAMYAASGRPSIPPERLLTGVLKKAPSSCLMTLSPLFHPPSPPRSARGE